MALMQLPRPRGTPAVPHPRAIALLVFLLAAAAHAAKFEATGVAENKVTFVWGARLDGSYIKEQHGATNECYDKATAMKKCEQSGNCHGISSQSNVCNGKYRVTHGGPTLMPTPARLSRWWRRYKIHSYLLNRISYHQGITGPDFNSLVLPNGTAASPRWYEPYQNPQLPARFHNVPSDDPNEKQTYTCNPATCNNPSACGIPRCEGWYYPDSEWKKHGPHLWPSKSKDASELFKAMAHCKPDGTCITPHDWCHGNRKCTPAMKSQTLQQALASATHSVTMTSPNLRTKLGSRTLDWTFFAMSQPGARRGRVIDMMNTAAVMNCFPSDTNSPHSLYDTSALDANPLGLSVCTKGTLSHTGLDPNVLTHLAHHSVVAMEKTVWCIKAVCTDTAKSCPQNVCYTSKLGQCAELTYRAWKTCSDKCWRGWPNKGVGVLSYPMHTSFKDSQAALRQLKKGLFKPCHQLAEMAAQKVISGG